MLKSLKNQGSGTDSGEMRRFGTFEAEKGKNGRGLVLFAGVLKGLFNDQATGCSREALKVEAHNID